MPNTNYSSDVDWVRLLEMMGNMLDAAKESDWQLLIELNQLREPVLKSYFTDIAPTLDTELLRDRIHVLHAIEKQILQYSQIMRDDTAAELKSLHRGKRVEQAYAANTAA